MIFFFLKIICYVICESFWHFISSCTYNLCKLMGIWRKYRNHKLQLNAQFHIMDSSSITFDSFSAECELELHVIMTQCVKWHPASHSAKWPWHAETTFVLEPYMKVKHYIMLVNMPATLQINLQTDGESHVQITGMLLSWRRGIKVSSEMSLNSAITCSKLVSMTGRHVNGRLDHIWLWCQNWSWLSVSSVASFSLTD